MLNENKSRHRPERLKGYNYASPGYYFVTFNTKVRQENILCSIHAEKCVGPAPLGGSSLKPTIFLTEAGSILQSLIENVEHVYCNAHIDCYTIMPDHVHLLVYLWAIDKHDDPPRGAGPTNPTRKEGPAKKPTALPMLVNALKSLSSKRVGYTLWQEDYYDHIVRNDTDLQAIRQYIQNNPLKWVLDRTD